MQRHWIELCCQIHSRIDLAYLFWLEHVHFFHVHGGYHHFIPCLWCRNPRPTFNRGTQPYCHEEIHKSAGLDGIWSAHLNHLWSRIGMVLDGTSAICIFSPRFVHWTKEKVLRWKAVHWPCSSSKKNNDVTGPQDWEGLASGLTWIDDTWQMNAKWTWPSFSIHKFSKPSTRLVRFLHISLVGFHLVTQFCVASGSKRKKLCKSVHICANAFLFFSFFCTCPCFFLVHPVSVCHPVVVLVFLVAVAALVMKRSQLKTIDYVMKNSWLHSHSHNSVCLHTTFAEKCHAKPAKGIQGKQTQSFLGALWIPIVTCQPDSRNKAPTRW